MMQSPLRPAEMMARQIEVAEAKLISLIDMNPQFARNFFDTFLIIQDWEYAKRCLEIAAQTEDIQAFAYARLAGRKEITDELAEIRDGIVEAEQEDEQEESEDGN
jgi:hypothetical protein